MTADARLRELQRYESADLETRARLLRERMRAGALAEERVRLAAWLGDPAAQRAVPGEEPPTTLAELITGLDFWPDASELAGRAALAMLGQAELGDSAPNLSLLRRLQRACEGYVTCPCDTHYGLLAELPNPPYPSDPRLRAMTRAARYAKSAVLERADSVPLLRQVAASLRDWLEESSLANAIRHELVPWALGMEPPETEAGGG